MSKPAVGKRSGSIRQEDFEDEAYLKRLDPIVAKLQESFPDARLDRRALGLFFAHLLQFMEDALGQNALPPKKFPKLPAQLFRNFSPDGPLYLIVEKCEAFRQLRALKKIEWLNPATRTMNLDLLSAIRRELIKGRHLTNPTIYVDASNGEAVAHLKEVAKRMQAEVAQTAGTGVTHIVYPGGDQEDGSQFLRKVEDCGQRARVHWWYLPDSYDEMMNKENAPEHLEVDRQAVGPWKVYSRWLLDSEKYNEWMNPCDYETEEFEKEQEAAGAAKTPPTGAVDEDEIMQEAGASVQDAGEEAPSGLDEGGLSQGKRARPSADGGGGEGDPGEKGPKKPKQDTPPPPQLLPEVDPDGAERISDLVVKQKVLAPYPPAMSGAGPVENLSQGQLPAHAVGPLSSAPVPRAEAPSTLEIPTLPQPPPKKKELYVVPAHAAWFQWNKIADVERRACPDFFNGRSASKTPTVYKEYRNFMVNKYREDPNKRLTFTEVRKYLAGDVNGILRVWEFLDSWGIINHMASDKKEAEMELETQGASAEGMKLVFKSLNPTPGALFNFKQPSPQEALAAAGSGGNDLNLVVRRARHAGTRSSVEAASDKMEFFCNAMPWVNCTQLRYHCTKYPDVDLCPEAFAEGRFPPGCSAKDFVKIDRRSQEPSSTGWSPQEVLLLLEGLELYGENWAQVAEHVGTKSQIQCVLHFLQLPIEDQFIEDLMSGKQSSLRPLPPQPDPASTQPVGQEVQGATGEGTTDAPNGASAPISHRTKKSGHEPIPFTDSGNPIMAQVAFLALMVGPKVAAAAAQRALEVLEEEDPSVAAEVERAKAGNPGAAGSGPGDAPSMTKIRAAAAAGLAAAAVKAKLLADHEEREIQRLVVTVVDHQLRKIDLKLKYLEDLEKALEAERATLEASRKKLDAERLQLFEARRKVEAQAVALAAATQAGASVTSPVAPGQAPREPTALHSGPTPMVVENQAKGPSTAVPRTAEGPVPGPSPGPGTHGVSPMAGSPAPSLQAGVQNNTPALQNVTPAPGQTPAVSQAFFLTPLSAGPALGALSALGTSTTPSSAPEPHQTPSTYQTPPTIPFLTPPPSGHLTSAYMMGRNPTGPSPSFMAPTPAVARFANVQQPAAFGYATYQGGPASTPGAPVVDVHPGGQSVPPTLAGPQMPASSEGVLPPTMPPSASSAQPGQTNLQ